MILMSPLQPETFYDSMVFFVCKGSWLLLQSKVSPLLTPGRQLSLPRPLYCIFLRICTSGLGREKSFGKKQSRRTMMWKTVLH